MSLPTLSKVTYHDAIDLAIAALARARAAVSESAVINHIDTALLEVGVTLEMMQVIPRQLSPFRTSVEMESLKMKAKK